MPKRAAAAAAASLIFPRADFPAIRLERSESPRTAPFFTLGRAGSTVGFVRRARVCARDTTDRGAVVSLLSFFFFFPTKNR